MGNSKIKRIIHLLVLIDPQVGLGAFQVPAAGEICEARYPWKNADDPEAKMKIVKSLYYQPWDWIISAGTFEDEFQKAGQTIHSANLSGNLLIWGMFLLCFTASGILGVKISKDIATPVHHATGDLSSASSHIAMASGKVAESLGQIVHKASEVDNLIAAIAAASREQSQGIDQVNQSMTRMDKVTQSNAATADESAIASEELSSQSAVLRRLFAELQTLVTGETSKALDSKRDLPFSA